MANKETQDMTGTGMYITLPDKSTIKPDDDPEPERYYDWMGWALRQEYKKAKSEISKTKQQD